MKFTVQTFGCKVNQYESTVIEKAMTAAGFERCEELSDADIVIINSCTVTDKGSRKASHAVSAAKKQSGGAVTVLTGCYPQAYPDEAARSGAEIVAGTAKRGEIPRLVREFLEKGEYRADMMLPGKYEEQGLPDNSGRTRAFIKIQDGCDRYCSYCVIPYARGRVRSRELAPIADEARLCADEGHREVVLVGINLSRYGSDIGADLADAVNAASLPDSIVRVRLSSLEPDMMTDALIEKLAACPKLCPHFHLSVQSGCDETLKRMNRHYDTAEYMRVVGKLRESFPGCAITTDIMVGFAGETDEEFARSLEFAKTAGFARIHVFTYSVRKGTAAAKLPGHIPESVKAERYRLMSEAAAEVYKKHLTMNIGKRYDVLIQKRTSPDYAEGLTPNYIPVRIYGSDAQRHDIVTVEITSTENDRCIGRKI
ncbi:MAG: tRNA (N(6)-L-threonylcarbamoyladenosine(37)-C(2))-methylthiotransferase MtaB [Ruminiclostridium sp.]|nr:tRNA (N(6)-L-threonylcarbamoyladenosine(37)-C(2))-methylthiotransferase MtaB [Ruminiclostridium sp.]